MEWYVRMIFSWTHLRQSTRIPKTASGMLSVDLGLMSGTDMDVALLSASLFFKTTFWLQLHQAFGTPYVTL